MAAIALLLGLLGGQSAHASTKPDPRIEQAASLLRQGKPWQARELYQSVLASNPLSVEAQQGLAGASERLALDARSRGDSDAALRLLLSAQSFAPTNPKLLYDLGVLEDSMNLYADADQTVARLQSLAGIEDPKVLYLAARVKLDLGQLQLAEKQMRAYLRIRADDASAHYGLGRILQLGQQPDQAQREFLRSIELRPQQTESYYQLGEIALSQARYDDALSAFAKTLAGDPAHGGALTGKGIAFFRLKDYDKALDTLKRAVAVAPAYRPAHYYLGLVFDRLGQKPESERELARAAELAQTDNRRDAQHLQIMQAPTDADRAKSAQPR